MHWVQQNGADLIGHLVTITVFIITILRVRKEIKNDLNKTIYTDLVSSHKNSILRTTELMEKIRIMYYQLALDMPDPNENMTVKKINKKIIEPSKIRSEWFNETIFLPPELRKEIRKIEGLFEKYTDAIVKREREIIRSVNDKVYDEIGSWRLKVERWVDDLYERSGKNLGISLEN